MAAKKRVVRGRSQHAGVVLLKPRPEWGHHEWRARYEDPDTGRQKTEKLDAQGLRNADARRQWAKDKAEALARRRMELSSGAPRLNRTKLTDATKAYRATRKTELRKTTLELYTAAIRRFETWCANNGVQTTADLTGAKLALFRDHLAAQRKQAIVDGGERGQRRRTREKVSPHTVNWQLRAMKSMLNHWRLRGLVTQLDRDAIADSLKPLSAPKEQTDYLSPKECARLLEAALRHDACTVITRAEEARLRAEAKELGISRQAMGERSPGGSTPRYEPIAPFIALLLLTGMRFAEALNLKWADVDLEAVDATGKKVGEIRLKASATKTGHGRTVGLEVAPQLRTMLAAMKLRAGKGATYVFPAKRELGSRRAARPLSRTTVEAARKRLQAPTDTEAKKRGNAPTGFGSPEYSWQLLRRTCGKYLVNAPAIYGAASIYLAARQLGHSVQVAEKHYLGVHRGVSKDARTLEEAMQIEKQMGAVVRSVQAASGRPAAKACPATGHA